MPAPLTARLGLAFVQVAALALLGRLWEMGESDATATMVDWTFVLLAAATPMLLGMLALAGRRLRHRAAPEGPFLLRALIATPQAVVTVLFVLTALLSPFVILVELIFGPIG